MTEVRPFNALFGKKLIWRNIAEFCSRNNLLGNIFPAGAVAKISPGALFFLFDQKTDILKEFFEFDHADIAFAGPADADGF
jgi:hypothetical protein